MSNKSSSSKPISIKCFRLKHNHKCSKFEDEQNRFTGSGDLVKTWQMDGAKIKLADNCQVNTFPEQEHVLASISADLGVKMWSNRAEQPNNEG